MNIEELNSCFDAISPTREQKDRIFAGVMSAKQQPVKVVKFYRYATAAAAVIVIGAFAAVYSNIDKNNITNQGNKTTVAVESSIDNVENTTVTEEAVETADVLTETNSVQAEEKGLADQIMEEYPQIVEEVPEDVKVAVEDDAIFNMNKVAETDSVPIDTPMAASDVESVAPAAGGGGGGASVYRAVEVEDISLEQIMNDEVYGTMFPTVFADGFEFAGAEKSDYDLHAAFNDHQGRYMSVSITKDTFVENVVEPEDIINLKSKYGYFNFAVNCGEYYVVYYVESNDASQVYEMVKSSAYFKN